MKDFEKRHPLERDPNNYNSYDYSKLPGIDTFAEDVVAVLFDKYSEIDYTDLYQCFIGYCDIARLREIIKRNKENK